MSDTLDRLKRKSSELAGKNWRRLLKAEVNPPWFWGVAGAAVLAGIIVLGSIGVYSILLKRPSVPIDAALETETADRKQSIEQAQKLFAAGQYDQTLALCRSVLARSPNNQIARRYAQMAETALAGRAQEAQKSAAAEQAFQAAQAAFGQGNYEEAKNKANEVLGLDGGRVDAQKLRDDATAKIAEAATTAAARKKAPRPAPAVAKRAAPPTPAPAVAARAVSLPTAAPVPNGPTTLRLLFDSPVAEGNVMVAVNDQILLRKQFDFRRKGGIFKKVSATGTVDVSLPVKPGAINIKAWLSGPDIPASVLAQANSQIAGGETRVLRLELSNGRLSARIQ